MVEITCPDSIKKNKYTWTSKEFDEWSKQEAEALREIGMKVSTAGVTRLLMKVVIIPNNITLRNMIKDKIRVKKRRRI